MVMLNQMCTPSVIFKTRFKIDDSSATNIPILGIAKVFHAGDASGPVLATCILGQPPSTSIQVGPDGTPISALKCTKIEYVQPVCMNNPQTPCHNATDCGPHEQCGCPATGSSISFDSAQLEPGSNILCVRSTLDSSAGFNTGDKFTETSFVNLGGGILGKVCPNCDCSGDGNVDPVCRTRTYSAVGTIPGP